MSLTDRFLRYVTMDTQSDHTSQTVPSTPGQQVLAARLMEELADLSIPCTCKEGVVYAHLKATDRMQVVLRDFWPIWILRRN